MAGLIPCLYLRRSLFKRVLLQLQMFLAGHLAEMGWLEAAVTSFTNVSVAKIEVWIAIVLTIFTRYNGSREFFDWHSTHDAVFHKLRRARRSPDLQKLALATV